MYESDDIRYQPPEERPPWELSPSGQLREWFSCRAVDGEGQRPCQEVGRARAARERRHRRRTAESARLQAERARAQENLRRISTSARSDPQTVGRPTAWDRQQPARGRPQPAGDPRGARYVYPTAAAGGAGTAGRSTSSQPGRILLIMLAVVLVLLAAFSLADRLSGLMESEGFDTPVPDVQETLPPEPDLDDVWDDYFEEDSGEAEVEAPAAEQSDSLQQAALPGDTLDLPLESSAGRAALSYQEIYTRCMPSVVSINTEGADGMGSGTGIVLTADGYILTCQHVLEDAFTCQVTTWEDAVYDAELVGGDAQTDLAVLKIDADGLTPAEFGRSDELTVGDEALAIGDPLGSTLRGTLTNGIISAINRDVTVNGYQMTLIQTTAALNTGNSGGPLINIYGQVVGVTNMKMNSTNVTVEGLGFAVPTSVVQEILPVLAEHGRVSRPVFGISCLASDGSEAPEGLIVASIDSASDATARGLEIGDCITHVDGVAVNDVSQALEILAQHSIGDEVTLTVLRQNEETGAWDGELTIPVTLMDQADLAG